MKSPLKYILLLSAVGALFTFAHVSAQSQTPDPTVIILGYTPGCIPNIPPSNPKACNLTYFVGFIGYLIGWLQAIVFPVGVLMLIYGGFVIITGGGNQEKFKKGKAVITTALVGIVIALTVGITVNLIYGLLTGGTLQLPK